MLLPPLKELEQRTVSENVGRLFLTALEQAAEAAR